MGEGIITKWFKLQNVKEKVKEDKKDKNLLIGRGISQNDDGYKAAKEAAQQALEKLGGQKPVISIVFYVGDYDAEKINKGLTEVFSDTEFIGGSADALAFDDKLLNKGITVTSLFSEFLEVGVGSQESISKNPYEQTKKALENALSKIKIDQYTGPYMQALRMKESNVKNLLKMPSYFGFVFARGFKPDRLGNENLILQAISDEIGLNIPLFGGSFGVPLEKLFKGEKYETYSFHSGKVMTDGVTITLFVTSLAYQQTVEHCCMPTQHVGYISKVEKDGYVVSEISNKTAIQWYCEKLKISKEEFLAKQGAYTQMYPLGIPDEYGSFMIRAGAVPFEGEKLLFQLPFIEGNPVFLMDASVKNILDAPRCIQQDYSYLKDKNLEPAITFAALCASRRLTLKEKTSQELQDLTQRIKGPLVGFYSFTEIGSKPGRPTKVQHLTTSTFTIYQQLLAKIK